MAQRAEAGAMIYEIRVDGRLDPARLADYAAVTARHQEAGTVLTCAIVDASALTGMIALIADLGLIVRDVHQVSAGASVTPSTAARRGDPATRSTAPPGPEGMTQRA